jgi:hypothetical protein
LKKELSKLSSYFKFLRRVRIHGRECGAVARALRHKIEANPLSAADKKVLSTTIERKVMSKTTFFKRIALTAIVALGFGMLSVAPSQAVVTNLTFTVANGTSTLTAGYKSDSTTAATITVSALFDSAGDSVTVSFVQKSKPAGATAIARLYYNESTTSAASTTLVDSPTVGTWAENGPAGLTTAYLSGSDSLTGELAGADNVFRIRSNGGGEYVGAKFFLQLESETARIKGTYTYTVLVKTYKVGSTEPGSLVATETKDVSITIADTDANIALTGATAIDPAKTTAVLNAGAPTTFSAVDSAVAVVATAAATNHASIQVRTYTADSDLAPESVTATITGAGVVCNSDGSICGKNLTIVGTGGDNTFRVRADGTAGVGSIVIKTTTVTFPAKTVTFYAKAAKTITVSAYQPVIKVGANTDVVRATALDADGNVWGGTAYIYASTAADALIASSATPVACTFDSALGLHKCPVAGTAKGTANLKVIDASTVALATATSDAAAVRVSTGVASSLVLSFDKATYAPGEKAQLRVQVLDGEGLAMPATTITNGFSSTGITTTSALGAGGASVTDIAATTITVAGSTSSSSDSNAGHMTYKIYMPTSAGKITVNATGGTGIALAGRVALTASATIVDTSNDAAIAAAEAASDAAAEAIDAANAATDAANLAAEAADAATVAAEEARDAADAATAAVEALATEVATLMAALKAQITTLANTVAKIAKKVKA